MSLRDNMARDVAEVFFCAGEFARVRMVNGRRVRCVDASIFAEKRGAGRISTDMSFDGNQDSLELYMVARDLPRAPFINMDMLIDGESWRVANVADEEGVFLVGLIKNEARGL